MCVCVIVCVYLSASAQTQEWLWSDTLVLYDISYGLLAFLNDGTYCASWTITEILHHIISEEFAVCLSGRISSFCDPTSSSSLLLPSLPFAFHPLHFQPPSLSPLVSDLFPCFSPSVRLSIWCSLFQLLCPSRTINPSPQPIPGPRSARTCKHAPTCSR